VRAPGLPSTQQVPTQQVLPFGECQPFGEESGGGLPVEFLGSSRNG